MRAMTYGSGTGRCKHPLSSLLRPYAVIYAPLALEAQARHRCYSSVQQPGSYDHTATVPGYQKGSMAQSGRFWGRLVARLAPAALGTPGNWPALTPPAPAQ